jgi:hypothetical protein
LWKTLGANPRV